jgi:hypothetical protein
MNRRATDCRRIGPAPVVWDQAGRYQAEQARQAHHTSPQGLNVAEAVIWALLFVVVVAWGLS